MITFDQRRKGAVMVLMVALFIAFMGLAALSVDIGFFHLQKARVQTAAESVALAVAVKASTGLITTYAGNLSGIENYGRPLAPLNAPGCNQAVFEWGLWSQSQGFYVPAGAGLRSAVRVTVTLNQHWFFGSLIGFANKTVTGQAVAVWTPYGNVWPLAISSTTNLLPGLDVTFGPDSTNNAPGNKGWLSFNGDPNTPSMDVYLWGGPYDSSKPSPWTSNVAFNQVTSAGYVLQSGHTGAGIDIEGTPGLKAALQSIVEAQVNAGMVILLPIWDSVSGQGSNAAYKIVGVVPVQLQPPYTGLDSIKARVMPEGATWFGPNENVAEYVRTRVHVGTGVAIAQ